MKINLFRNGEIPYQIHERLECVLEEAQKPEDVVPYIFGEFTPYELEKVTRILLETIKDLEHYKHTTIGLFCTDRPDAFEDPENLLFELK